MALVSSQECINTRLSVFRALSVPSVFFAAASRSCRGGRVSRARASAHVPVSASPCKLAFHHPLFACSHLGSDARREVVRNKSDQFPKKTLLPLRCLFESQIFFIRRIFLAGPVCCKGPQEQNHHSVTAGGGRQQPDGSWWGSDKPNWAQAVPPPQSGRRVFFHLLINERSLRVRILKLWIEKSEIAPVGP